MESPGSSSSPTLHWYSSWPSRRRLEPVPEGEFVGGLRVDTRHDVGHDPEAGADVKLLAGLPEDVSVGEPAVLGEADSLRHVDELVRVDAFDPPDVARRETNLTLALGQGDGLEGLGRHPAVIAIHEGEVEVLAVPGEDDSLVAELCVRHPQDAVSLLTRGEEARSATVVAERRAAAR